jgi:hypothetical protein
MSIRALQDAENVFRVEKRCKLCEQAPLSCEGIVCPANQVCVQNSRTCDECASVGCQVDPTMGPPPASKTNVGAIAGGVIGGIAFVAIVTFVVWKYCLKGKRRPISQQPDWNEVDIAEQEKDSDFQSHRSARASTHTVASMASSVLTRASNIIQIAYIPGVTNRGGPGSPDLLVPPVPPIPSMSPSSGRSSPYTSTDQHFFVPDFRDSIMSTSTAGRTSIAPSLAQRGSVASTMYRQNAIVSPLPAQTIVRGKAAVVSVKSNGSTSPADTPVSQTPPVPQIDPKHTIKPIRIQMPGISPANSVRSTAQLGPVKALNITKKRSSDSTPPKSAAGSSIDTERTLVNTPERLVPTARPLTASSFSSDEGGEHSRARRGSLASDVDNDEDDHARAKQTLLGKSSGNRDSDLTEFQDTTPTMDNSPFADSSSLDRPKMSQRITSYDPSSGLRTPMTPIVEEASASKRGSTVSNRRDPSPFSDTNRSEL